VAIVGECEPTVAILDALPLTGSVRAAESGSGGGAAKHLYHTPDRCFTPRLSSLADRHTDRQTDTGPLLYSSSVKSRRQTGRQTDRHRAAALLLVGQVSPTDTQTDGHRAAALLLVGQVSPTDRQTDRQTDTGPLL